jgi:hypothetical protein
MEKELSLTEVFKLLSEGKKVRNKNWAVGEYFQIVNNILVNKFGTFQDYVYIRPGHWYEYKEPTVDFYDFVCGKFFKTNLTILKEISLDETYTYRIGHKTDHYVVFDGGNEYAFVIGKYEFEALKADIDFFIEEEI